MVKYLPLLACLIPLHGCAALDGTVLVARDSAAEADTGAGDAAVAVDGALADASPPAAADTHGRCRIGGSKDGFYENFDGNSLSADTWLVAHGPITFTGRRAGGGFAQDNVSVEGGALVLRVRGDLYEGDVRSVDARGRPLTSGKRSAAGVATRDLFASATYQVQGHFTGPSGVEVALWYTRDDESLGALDLSTPGSSSAGLASAAYLHARSRSAEAVSENQLALENPFDDGAAHIMRFDWYTTAANAASFWVDDHVGWQTEDALPSKRAARLWIVAWLPNAGPANFDTAEIRIDNAFVTPFGNAGDLCTDFELEGPFLTVP